MDVPKLEYLDRDRGWQIPPTFTDRNLIRMRERENRMAKQTEQKLSKVEEVRTFARQASPEEIAKINSDITRVGAIDPKLGAVLAGEWDGDVDGVIDFGDMQGLSPNDPISASLSELEGEVVGIVRVATVPNQFYGQRAESSPIAGEFVFQREDGLFYRAVSSNAMVLKQYPQIEKALKGYGTVAASIIGVEVMGQSNKAYGFGSAKKPN